jgi:hypothetical protein
MLAAQPKRDVRWTRVAIASAACASLLMCVQLVIPSVLLFRPGQQRFGWQMFSTARAWPSLVVVHADGRREPLDTVMFYAFARGDLDPQCFDRLPVHVCRVVPGLRAVELQRGAAARPEITLCR